MSIFSEFMAGAPLLWSLDDTNRRNRFLTLSTVASPLVPLVDERVLAYKRSSRWLTFTEAFLGF